MRHNRTKAMIFLSVALLLAAVTLLSSCSSNGTFNVTLSVEANCAIDNSEESRTPTLFYSSEHLIQLTIDIHPLRERNVGDIYIDVVFENLYVEPTFTVSSGNGERLSDGRTGYRITTQLSDPTTTKNVEAFFRISLSQSDIYKKAVCRIEVSAQKNIKIQGNRQTLLEKEVAASQLGEPVLKEGLGSVELTLDVNADFYYLTVENINMKRTTEQTLILREGQVYVIDFKVSDVNALSLTGIPHFSNEQKYNIVFDGGADYRIACTAYSSKEGYTASPTSIIIVRV